MDEQSTVSEGSRAVTNSPEMRREIEDLWWLHDSLESLIGDRADGDMIRIGVLRNLLKTTTPETTTTHPRG